VLQLFVLGWWRIESTCASAAAPLVRQQCTSRRSVYVFTLGTPTPAVLVVVRLCGVVLDVSGLEAQVPKFNLPNLLTADAEDAVSATELFGDLLYSSFKCNPGNGQRVHGARRVVLYVSHTCAGGGNDNEYRVKSDHILSVS
jgi:hypothetical protein